MEIGMRILKIGSCLKLPVAIFLLSVILSDLTGLGWAGPIMSQETTKQNLYVSEKSGCSTHFGSLLNQYLTKVLQDSMVLEVSCCGMSAHPPPAPISNVNSAHLPLEVSISAARLVSLDQCKKNQNHRSRQSLTVKIVVLYGLFAAFHSK
ncbi:sodium-coupled monocarboxylate transporter 1 [Platysternon megacephalum]|uniref:Sodium-coupled monocarboxylate transporter 1 n=1 Tax=Platysternon megacephalum TaxID=55544 RepID=A0A4D9E2N7_9SAUR|nr:sodium-coupled monocarboxylate transporter 1 [Platysternon megacephalum]